MSISTTNLVDLNRAVADAARSVRESIATMREQTAAKRAELLHAQNAPYPRDEIAARIRKHVADSAAYWRVHHAGNLPVAFGSPHSSFWSLTGGAPVPWGALCAYAPEIADGIIREMEAQEYAAGPSSVERPAVVARLTAELQSLEQAEERAIDEAAAAGVTIEHRPEVTARRQDEASARRRADAATATQRSREDVINERHNGGRRSILSSYIANTSARSSRNQA